MSDEPIPIESIPGGNKPTPDPTVLTTAQLLRVVGSLEKLFDVQIDNIKDLVKANTDSCDKHVIGQSDINKVRFDAIDQQFAAIEAWRKEQKLDTKTAVDAALQAAEKAVREQTVASEKSITKSETSAAEQSKQQYSTFTASLKGVSDILADVKDRFLKVETVALQVTALAESIIALRDRVQSLESQKKGAVESNAERRSDTGNMLAIMGGVFGFIGVVATIISVMALLSK